MSQNNLANGAQSRQTLANPLTSGFLQLKGQVIADAIQLVGSDAVVTGNTQKGIDVFNGVETLVPTVVAVAGAIDGNIKDANGDYLASTHAEFVHGRQMKLYASETVDDAEEIGYTVDTSPAATSTHRLITSAAVKTSVDDEATQRSTADATLQSNLDAEAATRLAEDNALGTRVNTEIAERAAAIAQEVVDRNSAITAAVDALVDNAPAALDTLKEIATSLGDDPALKTFVTDQHALRVGEIQAEASARTSADAALGVRVDDEEVARASADTALGVRVDNEEVARLAADSAEATARADEDTALGGRIDDEEAARIAADSAEATARVSADTALGGRIDDEEAARIAALSAEAAARASADTALGVRIDNQEAAHIAAIAQEVTDRNTAISDAVDALVDNAPAALDTLKEIATSLGDDPALKTFVTDQHALRVGEIQAETAARVAAVSAEESARITADNALGVRVDDEEAARLAKEQQVATATAARTSAVDTALAKRPELLFTENSVDTLALGLSGPDENGQWTLTIPASVKLNVKQIFNVDSLLFSNGAEFVLGTESSSSSSSSTLLSLTDGYSSVFSIGDLTAEQVTALQSFRLYDTPWEMTLVWNFDQQSYNQVVMFMSDDNDSSLSSTAFKIQVKQNANSMGYVHVSGAYWSLGALPWGQNTLTMTYDGTGVVDGLSVQINGEAKTPLTPQNWNFVAGTAEWDYFFLGRPAAMTGYGQINYTEQSDKGVTSFVLTQA